MPELNSSNNFYQEFSVQGQKHQRSYMYTHKKDNVTISFIAVDACLLPGPRRPFNFIGNQLNKNTFEYHMIHGNFQELLHQKKWKPCKISRKKA